MRPELGEEMTRQPSLPTLTNEGTWCGPRVFASKTTQPADTTTHAQRAPSYTRAQTHRPGRASPTTTTTFRAGPLDTAPLLQRCRSGALPIADSVNVLSRRSHMERLVKWSCDLASGRVGPRSGRLDGIVSRRDGVGVGWRLLRAIPTCRLDGWWSWRVVQDASAPCGSAVRHSHVRGSEPQCVHAQVVAPYCARR